MEKKENDNVYLSKVERLARITFKSLYCRWIIRKWADVDWGGWRPGSPAEQ